MWRVFFHLSVAVCFLTSRPQALAMSCSKQLEDGSSREFAILNVDPNALAESVEILQLPIDRGREKFNSNGNDYSVLRPLILDQFNGSDGEVVRTESLHYLVRDEVIDIKSGREENSSISEDNQADIIYSAETGRFYELRHEGIVKKNADREFKSLKDRLDESARIALEREMMETPYEAAELESVMFGVDLTLVDNKYLVDVSSRQIVAEFPVQAPFKSIAVIDRKLNQSTGELLELINYVTRDPIFGINWGTVSYLLVTLNSGSGVLYRVKIGGETKLKPKFGIFTGLRSKKLMDLLKPGMKILNFDYETGIFHIAVGDSGKVLKIDSNNYEFWYQ